MGIFNGMFVSAGLSIPEAEGPVTTLTRQRLTIGRECDANDRICMSCKRPRVSTGLDIP